MNAWDPLANLLGEWSVGVGTAAVLFRIFLSLVLSAIVGWERSSKRHSAGLRTFMLVSLAGTLVMIIDQYIARQNPSHIFIVSGAAVIAISVISINSILFSSRNQIKGLTTSVGLWTWSLVGLLIGAGYYTIALVAFATLFIELMWFPTMERYLKNRSNHFEIHLELKNSTFLQDFVTTIRKLGLTIDDIELNPAYSGSGLSVYSVAISISSAELKKYKTHAEIIEALRTLEYVYHIEEI
ncbi:MAG: MgtC/SapB family protein [Lachnospiraceae bacterium]|nr:MgtC/SapB family protein [Lachnospiraceae bacterium]MBO4559163.1 MgtC/SapB family protein [Lachnospiraceae bacterium]MBR5733387.1 MgtC/SapB family protein [Lachnospiraceae bacterium]